MKVDMLADEPYDEDALRTTEVGRSLGPTPSAYATS
jgi:hypothetical protein